MNHSVASMADSRYESANNSLNSSLDVTSHVDNFPAENDENLQPPRNRMSFFSMKQFDPLLSTPASNNNRPGRTFDSPFAQYAERNSTIHEVNTPSSGSSVDGAKFSADRLIPVTPIVSANGNTPDNGNGLKGKDEYEPSDTPANGNSFTNSSNSNSMLEAFDQVLLLNDDLISMVSAAKDSCRASDSEIERLQREKEGLALDLEGAEKSFNELHGRYDRMKGALLVAKEQCDNLTKQNVELKELLEEQKQRSALLQENLEKTLKTSKKEQDVELTTARVQLKRLEMKMKSMESQLEQKDRENRELTEMIDEMTNVKA